MLIDQLNRFAEFAVNPSSAVSSSTVCKTKNRTGNHHAVRNFGRYVCWAVSVTAPNLMALNVHQNEAREREMDALVVGATFVGSCVTAFMVQKAVLGAVMRVLERGKPARSAPSPSH